MRSSATRDALKEILPLIHDSCFMEAALKWRKQQIHRDLCSDTCPYGADPAVLRCALCLEGRLRVVSLVSAERNGEGVCPYVQAADAIHGWLQDIRASQDNFAIFPQHVA